jgi:signal-transduction protein with cAMP-binding, CBS, and nucleotidyltransferase domain
VKSKRRKHKRAEVTPVTVLKAELVSLRRDLRATVRAYAARLEVDLAQSTEAIASVKNGEDLSREMLHDIREMMILLRNRKLKPQHGRRKDLRRIDSIIRDVHSITHPNAGR